MNLRAWSLLFFIGALWNFSVAVGLLAQSEAALERFYGRTEPLTDPVMRFTLEDFAACIMLFGVGYAIVGLNPRKNHGLLVIGIIGKLGVVYAFTSRYFAGAATAFALLPAGVDGVFALLFAWFLFRYRQTFGASTVSGRETAAGVSP